MVLAGVIHTLANVTITDDPNGLPGSAALQKILNGVFHLAEGGLAIALLAGAAFWALGHHSGNYRASEGGKMAVITSMIGAVIVGGGASIINFFLNAGQGL